MPNEELYLKGIYVAKHTYLPDLRSLNVVKTANWTVTKGFFIEKKFAYSKRIPYLCIIMRRIEFVNKIVKELKSFAPEADITLYGSEARGEARSDSDIDLLILLPDVTDIRQYIQHRSDISGRLYELSLDLGVEISPLILPRKVWNSRMTPFKINVINDGIRI